jgi:ADP-Ribosyltransferase in polyvalent proteins
MEHPKILHNGQLVHTTNSEGQRIHPTDEGIKNFHRWSEGKHLKDVHGRPAVVYHGTDTNFNVVNPDKGAMGSFWFASHKGDVADSGAVSTKIIKPLYIKMNKPAGWDEYEKYSSGELRRHGYDGAILPDEGDHHTGFVYAASQVKSADKNKGTFFHDSNKLND